MNDIINGDHNYKGTTGTVRILTIADLPKEEITHNMIFDLWFKLELHSVYGLMGRKSKQVHKTQPMWVKVFGYLPEEDMYLLSINDKMSKPDLLNYEYAMYPKEV